MPDTETDVVHIQIKIVVPTDRAAREALITKINEENGDGDSGSDYQSFVDPDLNSEVDGDDFDISDFAFWLLDQRLVSPTADDQVAYIDYETF